jgi:hypothetical protein
MELEMEKNHLTFAEKYNIEKYYHISDGIEAVAPRLLDDPEIAKAHRKYNQWKQKLVEIIELAVK